MHPVIPVRKQPIERGAIGERRILAHRRVQPLSAVMRIGFKRGRIERDERCAHRLRVLHALDRGMQPGDLRRLAGHQTAHDLRALCRRLIGPLPGGTDVRDILCGRQTHLKDQVGRRQLPEQRRNQRVPGRLSRVPCLKKAQDGRSDGMRNAAQHRAVLLRTGFKTGQRAVRLAPAVHAQHVRRVVAQEIGRNAAGTLHLLRHLHRPRRQDGLLPAFHLLAEVLNRPQLAAFAEPERKGHPDALPPGRLEPPLCRQLFIVAHQRLQDHRTTSQSRRSITPFVICARKNIGVMFSGSL